jgi:Flp pilus assembly protein TadD
MYLPKKITSLAILSLLPIALWQSEVNASATEFNPTPNILVKAERSVARGQSDQVIQLLDSKVDDLRRPEQKSTGYGFLCVAHYQKKDYVSAEKFCDKAVTSGSPNWSHLNNRGVMRFKLERYDEALVDFRKAASIMMVTAPNLQKHSVKHNISSTVGRVESM